jgi:CheY-like chemotaxis protein
MASSPTPLRDLHDPQHEAGHARMVLLVEDDAMLRTSVARGLRKIDAIEILEAGTVEEARAIALAMKPQLMIADLDLPDGTGAELVSELARGGFRVPVVFISAYVSEFSGKLPRRKDIVVREKPISLSDLRELVLERLDPADANEAPFHLTDYIQLACMSQRSAVLSLRRDGRLLGEIVVKNGDVWAAVDGRGDGEEAFRRLLFKTRTAVTVGALAEGTPISRNIHGSSQHVMMEAARLHDEGAGGDAEEDVFLDEGPEPLLGGPDPRRGDRFSRFSGRFKIDEPKPTPPMGVFIKPREQARERDVREQVRERDVREQVRERDVREQVRDRDVREQVRERDVRDRDVRDREVRSATSRSGVERKLPSRPELPAIRPEAVTRPDPVRSERGMPARFDAVLDNAVELFLKKRYDEALQSFKKAAEMSPGDARIERNLERLRRLGYY